MKAKAPDHLSLLLVKFTFIEPVGCIHIQPHGLIFYVEIAPHEYQLEDRHSVFTDTLQKFATDHDAISFQSSLLIDLYQILIRSL